MFDLNAGDVVSVIGDGGEAWNYMRAIISAKLGEEVIPESESSKLSFSEAAAISDIDVKKIVLDHEKRFRL